MDAAPTSGSSQPAVNVRLSSQASAGTYVVLKDSDGNTVLTAQLAKKFQSVGMSSPKIQLGKTYTVWLQIDKYRKKLKETAGLAFNLPSFCIYRVIIFHNQSRNWYELKSFFLQGC